MKLSVIIPCKNEVGIVENLLDSLVAQDTAPDEVIVVDSHSTDATAKVAKSYAVQLPLRVVTAQEKGLIPARNEGAAAASGDLLLFIDADASLPGSFITQFMAQQAARSIEIGGFSQHMISSRFGLRFGARLMNAYVKIMSMTAWPIFFSCFFATKAVHDSIHGFRESPWTTEDYDYAERAHKLGAKFGIIRGTHFNSSARRFESNTMTTIGSGFYGEVYRYIHALPFVKPPKRYAMGGKGKENQYSQT